MNYNQQVQGSYKCSNCSNKIPTGEESIRWTTDNISIYKNLFCRVCSRRGYEFPLSPDIEKQMLIIETREFKKWKEQSFIDEEEVKKLQKDLDDVRWGLPRKDEKG